MAVTLLTLVLVLAGIAPTPASAGGNDYPWPTANPEQLSPLRFNYRNCTDFVAWRLNTQVGVRSAPWRFTWSNLAGPGGNGHAIGWKDGALSRGYRVDDTPAVGAVAWWGTSRGSLGHVAIVTAVNADGSANIEQYNAVPHAYSTQNNVRAEKYLHIADVSVNHPQRPGVPGDIQVRAHGARVNLQWGAASGASEYQVIRNGVHLSTVNTTQFLDTQVSPAQAYTYAVVARNGAGSTAGASRYVHNVGAAGDRAYLRSRWGPAVCGRAGDQRAQFLVCNIRRSTGWTTSYSPATYGDWGYATDRAWLTNTDGSISYCRRVGTGNQARCDRYNGSTWSSSTSTPTDLGYHENRAYLPTKNGPAVCGRAGDQQAQFLVCNVLTSTGWLLNRVSPRGDWGYATDRAWLTNTDGSISYCRRVGTGNQARCDTFNGTTWTSSTSPPTDLAYADNRTYLPSRWGPAVCGRAGDQRAQFLVCNIRRSTGWTTSYSPATYGDWGYATDRAWLTNTDGSISYCRRVGTGNQARCDRYNGSTWSSSTSTPTDLGYHENRAYLPTKNGPAVCGRAGDQQAQFLVCNVLTSTGWLLNRFSPRGDWGYATDRAWLTNTDGTVTYCGRVGTGNQARCDTFNGTTWTSSTSRPTDLGYPDTF